MPVSSRCAHGRRVRPGVASPAMDRLTDADELLDGPLDDPAALAGNLRDLRRLNRALGGVRLSRLAVDRLLNAAPTHMDASPISIIDVGTGGADIPVAAPGRGPAPRPCAGGRRASTHAPRSSTRRAHRAARDLAHVPGLALDVSDGRSLPYPDGRSTSPTRRSSSTTSRRTRRSRCCGDGPRRAPRHRRQRPGPRAGCTGWAPGSSPPVHHEPLHPARCAAVRSPGIHARARCASCLPGRGCARSASSAGSSATATRSRAIRA